MPFDVQGFCGITSIFSERVREGKSFPLPSTVLGIVKIRKYLNYNKITKSCKRLKSFADVFCIKYY